MTARPELGLESIAEAVADETPVDWDGALAQTPAAASTLGNLRVLAALTQWWAAFMASGRSR